MIDNKKIAVVLPAYNAEKTLRKTYDEIPKDLVDIIILTDDKSSDKTLEVARDIPINHIISHDKNRGYGANQKTCYDKALSLGADIIIMLHPDYQYTPKLIPSMCYLISGGLFPVVLGSRILGKGALAGGMPFYKFCSNRILSLIQNILLNQKLSEYHTGYRAYSKEVLETISYRSNSDGYIFDNQLLAQIIYFDYNIGEITCPTEYSNDSSSINFFNSIIYGFGVLKVSLQFFLQKRAGFRFRLFDSKEQHDRRTLKERQI
jgi:glycosyltransferase involved in cell wall biosynthesis